MPLVVILGDQVADQVFSQLAASIDDDIAVRAFADPQLALDWIRNNVPHLVITAYRMPGMDGAEFVRRFREGPGAAGVPIIVITTYKERSFRLRALESGATDFLRSPVDPYEFVTRARNLLKFRQQQLLLGHKLEHSERSRQEALRGSAKRRLVVLVAEDNRTSQRAIARILERAGHEVELADNGEAALNALDRHTFDVVLMDVNMPVMSGIEATKLYRSASIGSARVPVVALTAADPAEDERVCWEAAGMDACVTKPVEPARLIEVIDQVVGERVAGATGSESITKISAHPKFGAGGRRRRAG